MRIEVFDDHRKLATAAADIVHLGLSEFAGLAFGVATGSTPLGLYAELARRASLGVLDTSGLRIAALDEYLGVHPDEPGSYASYVVNRIARPLGVPASHVAVPDGLADTRTSGESYEDRLLQFGGVGVQIAGIGSNGHLGFNEPGTPFESTTHVVRLSKQTRVDNQPSFTSGPVPEFALTQGIATILRARRVLLLATGANKASAVARALTGIPDPSCPASALQLHPDVVVLLDRAAASALEVRVSA